MPRALAQPVRDALGRAHLQGRDSHALARPFQLPRRTLEHLLRLGRWHHGHLPRPASHDPAPARPAADPVFLQAQALPQEHPDWGVALLRVLRTDHFPEPALPSSRTLQRWLAQVDPRPAPAGAAVVTSHLAGDPLSGDLYVFKNRRGDRLKVLAWQGEAVALPSQDLQTIPSLVAEHVQVAAQRIAWQVRCHHPGQSVETLSTVLRLDADPNAARQPEG